MKAWLVVNTFMDNQKFVNLYELLSDAFKKKNITLELKRANDISLEVGEEIKNKPDFAIFWDKDIYLAERLEAQGIKLFNSSRAVLLCDNKILMYQALAKNGIKIPRTFIVPKTFESLNYSKRDFSDNVIAQIGFPMVVKEAYGSFGEQVYLANEKSELDKIIDQIGYKDCLKVETLESTWWAIKQSFPCSEKTLTTSEVTSQVVGTAKDLILNQNLSHLPWRPLKH